MVIIVNHILYVEDYYEKLSPITLEEGKYHISLNAYSGYNKFQEPGSSEY